MTFPDLTHYAAEPVTLRRDLIYRNHDLGYKPGGLWVSVDSDYGWAEWCRDERFGLDRLKVPHDVVLRSDANVLLVDTLDKLDAFAKQYRGPRFPDSPEMSATMQQGGIRWKDVRATYQGLIIAPYQWERRLSMDFFFYYGWDCASGCIWDLDAIESFTAR
jgi:hypothetical protein